MLGLLGLSWAHCTNSWKLPLQYSSAWTKDSWNTGKRRAVSILLSCHEIHNWDRKFRFWKMWSSSKICIHSVTASLYKSNISLLKNTKLNVAKNEKPRLFLVKDLVSWPGFSAWNYLVQIFILKSNSVFCILSQQVKLGKTCSWYLDLLECKTFRMLVWSELKCFSFYFVKELKFTTV